MPLTPKFLMTYLNTR